jgi:hypothetical protein
MTTIQIFERNVYGRSTIYPTGELAPYIQSLTGKTTLDPRDLRNLQHLGHEIEVVPDPSSSVTRYVTRTLADA